MKLTILKNMLSPIQHELEIELPWDEVEKRIQTVLTQSRDIVEINGFRKGKAPLNLIRQHIGEEKVLAHELDLKWDYLRGADGEVMRRREADVAPGPDRQHINDPMGTNKVDLAPRGPSIDGTEYVLSAEGEPLEPRTTGRDSHIRFHGGFLEDKEFKTAAGSDRGHLYRMGVRHYSPALGRILQRDPFYNAAMVTAEQPLSINPYIYGYNQPTQYSDTSGYACCGQSAAGGLAETEPLRDKKKTGGYTGAGCIIPWPIDWGCWFPTCLCYCCVDEYSEKCPPCFHGVCLGMAPWKTAAECRAWCDNAAGGGEFHPSNSSAFNSGGGSWIMPAGPPNFGPDGNGGYRLWAEPQSPQPSVNYMLTRLSVRFTGQLGANMQIGLPQQAFRLVLMNVTIIGVITGLGAFALGASATRYCNQFFAANRCLSQEAYDICICEFCNEYNRCNNSAIDWGLYILLITGSISIITWNLGPIAIGLSMVDLLYGYCGLKFWSQYLACLDILFGGGGGIGKYSYGGGACINPLSAKEGEYRY